MAKFIFNVSIYDEEGTEICRLDTTADKQLDVENLGPALMDLVTQAGITCVAYDQFRQAKDLEDFEQSVTADLNKL